MASKGACGTQLTVGDPVAYFLGGRLSFGYFRADLPKSVGLWSHSYRSRGMHNHPSKLHADESRVIALKNSPGRTPAHGINTGALLLGYQGRTNMNGWIVTFADDSAVHLAEAEMVEITQGIHDSLPPTVRSKVGDTLIDPDRLTGVTEIIPVRFDEAIRTSKGDLLMVTNHGVVN